MQDMSNMKTKIIATTRYVDNKDYIFDEQIPLKRDEVEKLSNFSVRDCRIIKDDEADVKSQSVLLIY